MRKALTADSEKTPCIFPSSYESELSFPDITQIPGYASKARAIFDKLRADPENELLVQWFRIAVMDSGSLAIEFLDEWIETAADEQDLISVSEIISSEASRFAFSKPDLFNRLLCKAQLFSSDCLKSIVDGLVDSLVNRMKGYTNGIPDDQHLLNRSRELREQHAANPLLRELFDRVVRFEEADAEHHRRDFLARDEDRRRFE